MTVLYIILAVLAISALLLFIIRIGLVVAYDEEGLSANFLVGPFRFKIAPKEKKKPSKKREHKAEKKTKEPGEEKAGAFATFKSYWPDIKRLLNTLKKGLLIDEITIHYIAAGDDPVAVAINFGGVSAAMGMITSYLEQNFNIGKRDLRSSCSFEIHKPCIYFKLKITLNMLWVIRLGYPLMALVKGPKDLQKRKEEK